MTHPQDCSQKISKTFSHNNLESVLLFCTFEPKKCKCAFRVAVSACTLKILCCGYNMATIKKDKKIKDYDTRSCSGMVIFLSFRKKGVNQRIMRFTLFFLYPKRRKATSNHKYSLQHSACIFHSITCYTIYFPIFANPVR